MSESWSSEPLFEFISSKEMSWASSSSSLLASFVEYLLCLSLALTRSLFLQFLPLLLLLLALALPICLLWPVSPDEWLLLKQRVDEEGMYELELTEEAAADDQRRPASFFRRFSLARLFWNQTWTTRMSKLVSAASCSRMWRGGFELLL